METCPICNSKMIERKGKFGNFLGCVRYPACKGTRQIVKNGNCSNGLTSILPKKLEKIINLSDYQKDIENEILNGSGNLMVSAGAGSGKTSTIRHIIALLYELGFTEDDVIYLVYNKHNQVEAQSKGLPALTTHSLGLKAITTYLKKSPSIDDKKVNNIVKNLISETWDNEKWMISTVCDLVGKIKSLLCPTDNDTLNKVCDRFGIETNDSHERIYELARMALTENNKQLDIIDYNDMLYLPVKLHMPVKQFAWVLGDEVQDWSRVQVELILMTIKEGGRATVVGDIFQSMYGFRGADPESMPRLKEALNAKELPLSISYRCPKSHVRLVNNLLPNIPFEMFDKNDEGIIDTMSSDRMLYQVKDGDLVLCRTNAPLVKPAFQLIRQGVKAIIRGRDIGTGLISLIEKMKSNDLDDLVDKLIEYRSKEIVKLLKQEKTNQAASLEDRVETILQIAIECTTVYQLTYKINEIFSDKNEGVVFSTVHRAKGDEANRVFILLPQQMPHKLATKDWQRTQELNVLYVALTRSKKEMYFVDGPVPAGFMNEKLYEEETKQEEKEVEETKEPEVIEVKQSIEVIKQVPVCPF